MSGRYFIGTDSPAFCPSFVFPRLSIAHKSFPFNRV
jgi:hypothetical protein